VSVQVVRDINPTAFRTAYEEWKRCRTDLRLYLGLINDLACPACSDGLEAVHIDANMKLFTWQRQRETWRSPHYTELFAADDSMQDMLKSIYGLVGKQVRPSCCCVCYIVCAVLCRLCLAGLCCIVQGFQRLLAFPGGDVEPSMPCASVWLDLTVVHCPIALVSRGSNSSVWMHVVPCCQLPDATCRGMWAAAGTANQRRRANQHITGRSLAVDARHGGPLAAANLVGTGELYAYALCLVSRLLELKGGLRQLHTDIMCKWRPWSTKVLDQLAGASDSSDPVVQQLHQRLLANNEAELQAWRNMRMVNAAAHGSLHAQSCQVIHDSRLAEAWQPHFPGHGRCLCYLCSLSSV